MTLYSLFEDHLSINDAFEQLPTGTYNVHCVDNVLMVVNLTLNETYLYDIKSTKCATRSFCTIWNGIKPGPPELSLKISAIVEKPEIVIHAKILYDGRKVSDNAVSITEVRSPLEHIIETPVFTDKKLVSLGSEYVIDVAAGRCYRLSIDINKVVKEHPDRLESILFLFRRNGLRTLGFEYLCQAVRQAVPLLFLSSFFDTVNSAYKIASQGQVPVLTRRNTFSGNVRDLLRQEVKTNSGVTVLLQSDLYDSVFVPLFEQQSVEAEYLTSVVLTYVRSLVALEIPLNLNLQILLARLLIQAHSYTLLEELALYSIFNDSRDFAHLLLSLSKSHGGEAMLSSAFQLAIDMLFRLKLYDEVADVFLSRGLVYEVARMSNSANPPRYSLDKLYRQAEDSGDPELVDAVQTCMKRVSSTSSS